MTISMAAAGIESTSAQVHVRLATLDDLARIEALQTTSMRALGRTCYSSEQIEALIRFIPMMDGCLISDGGYFVAELGGRLMGCGGWSEREPGYRPYQPDSKHSLSGSATVRAMYVHPQAARCGIGRRLLALSEAAMVRAGHTHASLDATLPGVPLYKSCGYVASGETRLETPDGVSLQIVVMSKRLAPAAPSGMTP